MSVRRGTRRWGAANLPRPGAGSWLESRKRRWFPALCFPEAMFLALHVRLSNWRQPSDLEVHMTWSRSPVILLPLAELALFFAAAAALVVGMLRVR